MSFSCSDKDALIAYVYGECDSRTRDAVELHLTTCPACADEIAGFGMVRQTLGEWSAPERVGNFRLVHDEEVEPARVLRPARWWQSSMPALARVAAAILLFAGGAALANLEVRYDKDGFMVRTGWNRAVAAPAAAQAAETASPAASVSVQPTASSQVDSSPWRIELASLERQLRDEFRAQMAAARASGGAAPLQPVQVSAAGGFDENRFMQRVHTLLDESERRQQIEMAYRISQVMTDVQAQRRADMVRVQQSIGGFPDSPTASPQQRRQLMGDLFPVSLKR
jgi:hypothetical protein